MRTLRALLVALLTISALDACATRPTQEPPIAGADFILEIHNPMPHAMNVMYHVGGSQTTLGSLAPNETKRWTVPNRGDDSFLVSATAADGSHKVEKTIDLDKGEVIRWVIEK